ncbi:hypothetical protein QTL97_11305 [Sporosarcina thermotolerans]|uniref:Uncharacterized protein n=1 Tax=Sporosarcina thermotolerans TaxID=633404 RepID=A0AAW9AAW0_9BACL|nr:hypothetical protein [Sporosarcina thermotolerans]MDW0117525.1 hypothetical protein [Sporosarcina thermotolerans]WHT49688.1 hypothetical protein QNH10_09460 [Sporosarcina thermotolerans]
MTDFNKRKPNDNDTGKAAGTGVGAFTGDTMATALDPFGTAAVSDSDKAPDNKAREGNVDDNKDGPKTRDKY